MSKIIIMFVRFELTGLILIKLKEETAKKSNLK